MFTVVPWTPAMMGARKKDRCVQTLIYPISINMHSGFHQIALEGIKKASGFVALDDIEYTIGVNCDDQRVDPKPGEMHRWREQILKMDGLIHIDVLRKFKVGCY